jgi:small GTP-binding protein
MQAKILLCGEGFVGKSTIRERYIGVSFRASYLQTIGADYATRNQEYEPGKSLRLQIWDLAGQQRFANIRETFYKGSDGVILVFDISNRESGEKTLDWVKEIQKVLLEPLPILLVGNKIDLRSSLENPITSDEGLAIAKRISDAARFSVPYIESSALTGENIQEIFAKIAHEIVNFQTQENSTIENSDSGAKKYYDELNHHIHHYFFKMSQIGPTCVASSNPERDENLLVKMAVFYSTTLGQGKNAHEGLFGPFPVPDSKDDPMKSNFQALIYSFNKFDAKHHDPRAKGMNFCFIVTTIDQHLLHQFSNSNAVTRCFHTELEKAKDVVDITDDFLLKLKKELLKNVYLLNNAK